jgi:hypothetical protein
MSDDHDVTFTEEMTGELALTGQAIDTGRVVRPGDVLVLSVPPGHPYTNDRLAEVRDEIRQHFPELADVRVLGSLRFEFVYRQDDEQ